MSPNYPRIRLQGTLRNESYGFERDGEELIKKVREHVYERVLARDVVRISFFIPQDHHHLTAGVTHALDSYLRAIEGHPGALSDYTCCWWQSFKPTETVQELEGERAVVTLGEAPEAGDLDQGQTLPAYRELARVLEPYLEPFPWGFLERKSPSVEEELRRWWRRFLD